MLLITGFYASVSSSNNIGFDFSTLVFPSLTLFTCFYPFASIIRIAGKLEPNWSGDIPFPYTQHTLSCCRCYDPCQVPLLLHKQFVFFEKRKFSVLLHLSATWKWETQMSKKTNGEPKFPCGNDAHPHMSSSPTCTFLYNRILFALDLPKLLSNKNLNKLLVCLLKIEAFSCIKNYFFHIL